MRFCHPDAIAALISLSLFGAPSLVAGDTELSRRSLRGIGALDVVIESLPAGAQKIGLAVESLKTDVELRLRQNGIKVTDDSMAVLYVEVNVSTSGEAASLSVELRQPVRLVRDQSISVMAATWDVAALVWNPNAKFVRDSVASLIDNFLNAWLSVNPKAP